MKIFDNLEEINDSMCCKRFYDSLMKTGYVSDDDCILLSNFVGFQKYYTIPVSDLLKDNIYEEIKKYHYMSITLNEHMIGKEKFINAIGVLIDVDANALEERDTVIEYAEEKYSDNIISIITKSPKPENQKHKYGCHILIQRKEYMQGYDDYKDIMNDFTSKFECIDKHTSFACVKSPFYQYFELK